MTRGSRVSAVWLVAASAAVVWLLHQDARAASPAQTGQAGAGAAQRPVLGETHSGAPITVDLQGADIRTVLRSFAEANALNMVIDPEVKGTVDVKLTDVPWDQALEIILRTSRLGYVLDGTVIRVAPLEVLAAEATDRQRLIDAQAPSALELRTFPLSYADATKLEPLIKGSVLSKYGDTKVDERTNTLIIRDVPTALAAAESLIKELDRSQPQVSIEARIIETDRTSAQALGFQWGVNGRATQELGSTTSSTFPNTATVSGRVAGDSGALVQGAKSAGDPRASTLENTSTAVNLAIPSATTAIGTTLGSIGGAFNLDVALSALEQHGKVKILSTPSVTTQNNVQAEVTQGFTIPYQTVSNNTVTVSFRDAALKLTVTPHITAAGTVVMDVDLENGFPDFSHTVNGNPAIKTQKATTQLLVGDGVTSVIGGIVVNNETTSTNATPGLSRIPLLGWLFKSNQSSDENDELLIFITPHIVRSLP
jgi:type IV pilus assembly protein PilQ